MPTLNSNTVPSNCGNVAYEELAKKNFNKFKEHLDNLGGRSLTRGGIQNFYSKISKCSYSSPSVDLSIPLKFNWVLVIEAKSAQAQNLLNMIKTVDSGIYENSGWQISDSASTTFNDDLHAMGCIFAQGVNLPGESVKTEYTVIEGSNRGFINAPYINGRSDFEPLEVGFLETHKSFVDGFLRPWSILVAHRGLVAQQDSVKDLKANIRVYQLSRNPTNDAGSIIRKTFVFENCAPISISPETLSYAPSNDFAKMQVKFTYSRYYISDVNSSEF